MSDEAPKTPEVDSAAPAPDEFKNFKAEMGRKLGNLEQTNAQLLAQLQAMNSRPAPAHPAAGEPKVSDVWFDKPDEAARMIEERTEKRIEAKLAAQQAQAQKQQATLASLVAEFPELNQGDSDLAKRAVEIYNALPEDERATPMAYKVAVKDAALELGVKPKSRRAKSEADDFSLSSSKSAARPPKKNEVDPAVEFLAEQFGVKLTPEVKERVAKNHGRKSYSSWE